MVIRAASKTPRNRTLCPLYSAPSVIDSTVIDAGSKTMPSSQCSTARISLIIPGMLCSSLLTRPSISMSIVGLANGASHTLSRRAPLRTKLICVRRNRQAIQKPLHGIILHQLLKSSPLFTGFVQQTPPHGSTNIFDRSCCHSVASR